MAGSSMVTIRPTIATLPAPTATAPGLALDDAPGLGVGGGADGAGLLTGLQPATSARPRTAADAARR
jgi:hypothetical protein